VRGIDGTSWNNKRLAGVSFILQVRKHLVECHADDSSNVLTNDPRGLERGYNLEHCRPEITVIRHALSDPGLAEWLARESSGNNVNRLNCSGLALFNEVKDVSISFHLRPMFRQHLLTELVPLNLPGRSEPSPLHAKIKATYAGK
jgi:hypothetical protein